MAHFAELDENNIVLRVVVVDNKDCCDKYGVEKESIGVAHLEKILGGRWLQTSYNHNIRNKFAGIGYHYFANVDAFVQPRPFPSWQFNETLKDWEAPIPRPSDDVVITGFRNPDGTFPANGANQKHYHWHEETLSWEPIILPEDSFDPSLEQQ